MLLRFRNLAIAGLFAFGASNAAAYVGPGLGAGTIGVVLGLIGSVFLAVFVVVWHPIKRLFKRRKDEGKES